MPRKAESRFAELREKTGREYWRSLEELAETDEFLDALRHEFPEQADTWCDGASRRDFLKLMGGSLALAGLSGCFQQPEEKIVPYVDPPEEIVPGIPLHFATAFAMRGRCVRTLVESHMGRPTKIEGNPVDVSDPEQVGNWRADVKFGPSGVFSQASLLSLYDPDRSQTPLFRGQSRSWRSFRQAWGRLVEQYGESELRLRVLSETVTSPTAKRLLDKLRERFPQAVWHQYEPINDDAQAKGLEVVFGERVEPVYDFSQARVVFSLDDDFLMPRPETLAGIGEFAQARKAAVDAPDKQEMPRLYTVDAGVSSTGAKAEHRLGLAPQLIPAFVADLAVALELEGVSASGHDWSDAEKGFLNALASDLQSAAANGLVTVGLTQPPAVHAVAALLNAKLGANGTTISYQQPVEVEPVDHSGSLVELVRAIRSEEVDVLVILGGNPAYSAPGDLRFGEALQLLEERQVVVHLSEFDDETSALSHWHLPLSHDLEAWGDVCDARGVMTIQQPLIAPLYESKSAVELLAVLAGESEASGRDVVHATWTERTGLSGKEFDDFFQTCLHDGFVPETAAESVDASPVNGAALEVQRQLELLTAAATSGPVLTFRPDASVWDGRFANNAWLQELPAPLTKLTWDNALLVSPATAEELSWEKGDMIHVVAEAGTKEDVSIEIPVLPVPGHADGSVSVSFGYGRSRCGSVGNGVGTDVYPLRTIDAPWFRGDVRFEKVGGEKYKFATTQQHYLLDGREIIRAGTFEELKEHPEHPHFMHSHHEAPDVSMYPETHELLNGDYQWGMVVDMTACVGCNACVVACQSENNIPVVGREEVLRGREMHWMRIDTYYSGEEHDPETYFQPVFCQHCELAPCEVVCPVGATTHSPEGINEMTYNRCIGTRYCSNNCPYKVRRFNFLDYTQDGELPVLNLLNNPDVTVRNRGVMEKCTYCVQRINKHRIQSELEDRRLEDGEVQTACQSSCPAQAITFGDIADETTEVARRHQGPLTYGLLEELNTRPRTRYAAKVSHPHPSLHSEGSDGEHS